VARDLIPPPSPAGRPAPDPEPHEPGAPEETAPLADAPAGKPGPSPFRSRFGFITGLLAGCALAAAALFVVLLGQDEPRRAATPAADPDLAANWSTWRPQSTAPISGAQEIAKKIGGTYKDAKAKRLVKVKGGRIAIGTLPIPVAIPSSSDDRYTILPGLGVQYTLAGYGKEGRLVGTEPSEERHRLLRREALELSLYSFRYLSEATMVVALLPPAPRVEQVHPKRKGRKAAKPEAFQRQALFYRRGELRDELKEPLAKTLATKAPRLDELSREEAKRIDRLTLKHLYTYVHHQEQDGSVYLLLDRPS
jgi:hypothetical protein